MTDSPREAPPETAAPLPDLEKRAARLILAGFLAAIVFPYLFTLFITPPNLVWSGLLLSVDDQNVHLMWSRQARDGAFFLRDLFTTEPLLSGQRPLFFNLFPLLVGNLSRLTGLEVGIWYHIVRVAAGALGLWQFHELSRAVTQNQPQYSRARLIALFLVAFTLGGGFLGTIFPSLASAFDFIDRPDGSFPIMPEAFFVLSALVHPINVISMALLALIFRLTLQKRGIPAIFVASLALSNIHTYDALPLMLALGIWSLWMHREGDRAALKLGAAAIAGALIPVLYQSVVFSGSEEFRVKALTVTAPPRLIDLVFSFAPLLVGMALSRRATRELPGARLLWVWIVAVFALVYVPTSVFPFARKMMEGVQFPMAILAALGISDFLARFQSRPRRLALAGAFVLIPALSTALVWSWTLQNATENNASRWKYFMPPISITRGEAGALKVLNGEKTGGAVLCLPFIGTYVPRATGQVTYLGHWAETLRFGDKLGNVDRFYRGIFSPQQAREFLARERVRYVIFGPFERQIAKRDLPAAELGLTPIFQGGDAESGFTTLYRVG